MADDIMPESQAPLVEQAPDQTPAVPVFDISGQQPVQGTMHPDEITDAVASGKFSLPAGAPIKVVSPDGEMGTLDPAEAPQAFQNGYKYATQADLDKEQYGTPVEQAKTMGEGAVRGLLGETIGGLALDAVGSDPEARAKRETANPGEAFGSKAVGFVAPALASLGSSALARAGVAGMEGIPAAMKAAEAYTLAGNAAKVGQATAKLAGMGGEASTIAGKLAASGVKIGAEMALFQTDDEVAKAIQGDPNQTAQSALVDIGGAALFGGVLGVGGQGVNQMWKASGAGEKLSQALGAIKNDSSGLPQTEGRAINPIVKKVLSVAANMPEADIEAYAANRAAVNAAPEFEDIYSHALGHIEKINQAVLDSKITSADAEIAYKQLASDMKQEYKQRGFDVSQAAKEAKANYAQAQKDIASNVQQKALDKAEPVSKAVATLRDQVTEGSSGAYDVLGASSETVPMDNFYAQGDKLVQDWVKKGTPESSQMAGKLKAYLEHVKAQLGDAPLAADIKPRIQGLDALSTYNFNASEFEKGLSKSYKQLRHTLDTNLKTAVPAYREAMKPVAEKTKLLAQLGKYGEEGKANSAIKNLVNPVNYRNEMDMLRALETHTGESFVQDLERYANPEMKAKLIQADPSYRDHIIAARIEAELKNPETLEAMNKALAESKEHMEVMTARQAKAEAEAAKKELAGVTPSSLENALKRSGRGALGPTDVLSKFPEINGQSLPEALELSRVKNAFTKATPEGSKKVNMFGGVLGGVGGAMLGHGVGSALLGIGAGIGGAADRYGTAAAKRILDAYLDRFGDVAKLVAKPEARSAVRVALARMIDKDAALTTAGGKMDLGAQPNLQGFKSAVDYIHAMQKGDKLIKTASRNLFKAEADILPKAQMPSPRDLEVLKKNLKKTWEAQQGPQIVEHMNKTVGPVAHYMPEHGAALSQTAANVAEYLKSMEPKATRAGMLDALSPVSAQAKGDYERTLGIAQQPLMVLDHIKKGTLTPKDMQDFKAMFPSLYAKVAQEITAGIVDHTAKGAAVPYKTRLGLSLFLGQPVDSTMMSSSILSAQPKPQESPQPQGSSKPTQAQAKGMNKLPQSYQTPAQAREQENQNKK